MTFRFRPLLFALGCVLIAVSGCERAEPIRWTSSELVTELPDEDLQQQLIEIVQQHAGTAAKPKLVSPQSAHFDFSTKNAEFDFSQHLKHGQAVYMRRCVQCHGVNGDGQGSVAQHLYPRPRDYTKGIFKFTSTAYGSRPRRDDLLATVRRGVTGTSMPSFDRISKKDLEAVVDYVLVLAQRGELEYQLAMEADAAEELDPEYVPEFAETVVTLWSSDRTELTQPLTPQPELTADRAALGRKAFLSKGCSKCHGEDGRGHTKDNIGKDYWGYATRAADLTSGMLRGGQEPVDIYRRIMNGINGTPMPGFKSALQAEPETIWNLVAYVQQVSNRRRFGEQIPAGMMKPYDTAANTAAAEGE